MPRVQRTVRIYGIRFYRYTPIAGGGVRADEADPLAAFGYMSTLPFNRSANPNAYKIEHDKALTIKVDDDGSTTGIVKGQFASIRTDILPMIEDNGILSPPPISDTAGIYDASHFVYFHQRRQIVIEVNQGAPSYTQINNIFSDKMANHNHYSVNEVQISPMMRADVFQQLQIDGIVAELEFEIIRGSAALIANSSLQLGDIAHTLENLPAGPVSFTIGLKGERGGSIGGAMQQEFLNILRNVPGVLKSANARIRSHNPGAKRTDWVNLMEDKMAYYVSTVALSGRTINSTDMYDKIIQGYNNYAQ